MSKYIKTSNGSYHRSRIHQLTALQLSNFLHLEGDIALMDCPNGGCLHQSYIFLEYVFANKFAKYFKFGVSIYVVHLLWNTLTIIRCGIIKKLIQYIKTEHTITNITFEHKQLLFYMTCSHSYSLSSIVVVDMSTLYYVMDAATSHT